MRVSDKTHAGVVSELPRGEKSRETSSETTPTPALYSESLRTITESLTTITC